MLSSDRIRVPMEAVTFDGKEYVKASVLAKRFSYTSDYLGQLCRGKKVDARLVGRAWYINVDSLNAHKDTRYKAPSKAESFAVRIAAKLEEVPKSHYLSRIDVEPILKKKTVSLYRAKEGKLKEFPVKYEPDEYALIPRVHKEAISKTVHVNPAEAEALKIKKPQTKVTAFKPEPLPEVYLRGTLKIADATDIEDTEGETEVKKEPETKPERQEPLKKPLVLKVRPKTRVVTPPSQPSSPIVSEKSTEAVRIEQKSVPAVPKITLERPRTLLSDMKPKAHTVVTPAETVIPGKTASVTSFKPEVVKKKEATRKPVAKPTAGWLLPVVTLIFGAVVGVALLGIQGDVNVTRFQATEHFYFSTEQLEAALALVPFETLSIHIR